MYCEISLKKLAIFIGVILLPVLGGGEFALAGWSEDVRLTYRRYENAPQVIARNDTVHVAWQQLATDMHISYNTSRDGGEHWEGVWDLEAVGHRGSNIDLSLTGNRVFLGWSDVNTNGPNSAQNASFSACSSGGEWGSPRYVYPDTMRDHPSYDGSIINYLDSIYFVYNGTEHDSSGFNPINFLYSSDYGQSWSQDITVGHTYNYTNPLQIAKCGGTLYIVWSGDNPPEIFNRRVIATISRDGGLSWSEPFLISSNEHTAQHSCVACDEETGYFAVGWMDFTFSGGFPGDLFVRLTTDGGISWGDIHYATSHHKVASPQIDIRGDSIWAVWTDWDTDYGNMNYEICFSRTIDLGFSWTPYERLTYAEGYSFTPWISYDGGRLHVVWEDDRDGAEIYYKRFDPEPDAISEKERSLPSTIGISAYPSPFNSTTVITFSNLKGGEIEIFDIKGQSIRTFFTGGENEGRIKWDATDASGKKVSSGIYFARAEASQKSQTIKLIYQK
jgi:hypothetical protein